MSIDYDALLIDPIYQALGLPAQFLSHDGEYAAALTVIDKTQGVEIPQGGIVLQAAKPAVCVRVSELTGNGLDRAKMKNGRLTFNGACWNIEATRPKPVPGGTGELYLFLQERSDD